MRALVLRSSIALLILASTPLAIADEPAPTAAPADAPTTPTPAPADPPAPANPPAPASPPAPATVAAQPEATPIAEAPPRARARRRPAKKWEGPTVTYPAFSVLEDGTSRIVVRVDRKIEVEQRAAEGRVTYVLKGAGVPVRNNRLPLLTTFFRTPVERLALTGAGEGALLIVELREPATPTYRVEEVDGGIKLVIDVPRPASTRGEREASSPSTSGDRR